MNYQEAIDYIFSFVNYEKTGMPPASPTHFNLGRMVYLLEKLDNPQLKYPSIVIAGTKGKGSTAALCAAAFEAGGYRAGLYSQPHLHSYRERMRINGQLIEREKLAELVTKMHPAIEATLNEAGKFGRLTYYEIGTALALLYFAEAGIDMAVLEIGLGGRLDAVNVVTPLVSVITSISYDHIEVLGDTLALIAGEKAGIIKPNVPIISAPQALEASAVIEAISREKNAPLFTVVSGKALPEVKPDEQHRYRLFQQFILPGLPGTFETPLLGEHQLINAAVAAKALQLQAQNERGLKLELEQIREGFRRVSWPGRLEVLQDQPLLIVDGAHNAESARRLAQSLNRDNFYFERIVFVIGAFADKDIEGIFGELKQAGLPVAAYILTKSQQPRALSPAELKKRGFGENLPEVPVVLTENVSEALTEAQKLARPLDLICATGSLYITAEVRELSGAGEKEQVGSLK